MNALSSLTESYDDSKSLSRRADASGRHVDDTLNKAEVFTTAPK